MSQDTPTEGPTEPRDVEKITLLELLATETERTGPNMSNASTPSADLDDQ